MAADLSGTPEINMEQVYEWDPDIIFITNFSPYQPDDLYNNTIDGDDWSNVTAVKNQQVYKFPLGMYRWFPPASDTPLVLKWLATKIQPDLFKDLWAGGPAGGLCADLEGSGRLHGTGAVSVQH